MANQSEAARDMLQKQLKELDQIFQETMETLNTVAGAERVAKWKTKTSALITEFLGQKEGQKFASLQPGPSFTNDLVEEFTDLTDYFRIPLVALAKQLAQAAPRPTGEN
jgi:vacuolar-type H+-ATPase subunit E/Vma4